MFQYILIGYQLKIMINYLQCNIFRTLWSGEGTNIHFDNE